MSNFNNKTTKNAVIANEKISSNTLRVSDENGNSLGVMPTTDALREAQSRNLDLVVTVPNAKPPVAKIIELNKYNYELKKREKEAAKSARANIVDVKEIKFRIGIGDHDIGIKIKQVMKFLDKNAKVKITIQLRGREISKGKEAVAYFSNILDDRLENFKYEQPLKLAGNRITGVITNV